MSAQSSQRIFWGAGTLVLFIWFLIPGGHHGFSEFLTAGMVVGLGSLAVSLKFFPGLKRQVPDLDATQISRPIVEKTVATSESLLEQLETLAEPTPQSAAFKEQLQQIDLHRQEPRLLVTGAPGVGKSTLMALLQSRWCQFQKDPCAVTEIGSLSHSATLEISPAMMAADLILYVIQGDLTESEHQCLQTLQSLKQRVLVVLNKQDQYLPTQRLILQQKIQQRLQPWLSESDIVAVSAHPQAVKVRRFSEDGSCQEDLEHPQPDLSGLVQRLDQVMAAEKEQLILFQAYQQTVTLRTQVQGALNGVRRQLASPIIERYQWITGATAFANPVPTLDMLAAAAISAKMVTELGSLYRLKFSLAQAQVVASTLATAMLKLGLVEVSTQALSSLLKGHHFTFVAGGLVQGVSTAHLTRVAGLSLIEHFQELSDLAVAAPESNWDPEKLKQIVAKVFQEHQKVDALKAFAQQSIGRFRRQGGLLEAPAS
ncbi:DUF697 domain-containing protein [Acaryochloris sp. IP29b_bin.137]|uniref:YcjF family protein n=1 Tax=Acaryochloris sp. IP29b_bin.137 TaxID=2969217 RepID=UPI00261B2CC6|nr:DUF697 domain-containing protein [Acaryochloris sp. IP29b_bin.137]